MSKTEPYFRKPFTKIVRLGTMKTHGGRAYSIFCKINVSKKEKGLVLSISGVEGPTRGGNCIGACGQIDMHLRDHYKEISLAPGWCYKKLKIFFDIWEKYHLNDMGTACVHQIEQNWGKDDIEIGVYAIKKDIAIKKHKIERKCTEDLKNSGMCHISADEQEVLSLPCTQTRPYGPDFCAPSEKYYDLLSTSREKSGHIQESKHPLGVLGKPCPVCGYRYGWGWVFTPIPDEALEFLKCLPDTDKTPEWV